MKIENLEFTKSPPSRRVKGGGDSRPLEVQQLDMFVISHEIVTWSTRYLI